jgi:hypothetical protein
VRTSFRICPTVAEPELGSPPSARV